MMHKIGTCQSVGSSRSTFNNSKIIVIYVILSVFGENFDKQCLLAKIPIFAQTK